MPDEKPPIACRAIHAGAQCPTLHQAFNPSVGCDDTPTHSWPSACKNSTGPRMNTPFLYLPITAQRLRGWLVLEGTSLFQALDAISLHEAVSVMAVIQINHGIEHSHTKGDGTLSTVETQVIAPLYEAAASDAQQTLSALRLSIRRCWPKTKAHELMKGLDEQGVRMLIANEIDTEAFVTPIKRHWRYGFRQEATKKELTPATVSRVNGGELATDRNSARATSRMIAESGEHGALQGVAGCGKTETLARVIAHTVRDSNHQTLVLSLTDDQRRATEKRLKEKGVKGIDRTVHVRAVRQQLMALVRWHIHDGTRMGRGSARYHVDEYTIAQTLSIHPLTQHDRATTVRGVAAAVRNFCYSAAHAPDPVHCPKWLHLSPGEDRIIAQCAQRYWQAVQSPVSSNIDLPLRLYHLWKIAEQYHLPLPAGVSTVFVDEAHDLPAGIIRWLKSIETIGLWFVGDEFQYYGYHKTPFFARGQRQEVLQHSYRCDRALDNLVNLILERHPANQNAGIVFEGHPNDAFRVRYYSVQRVPEPNTVVICRNEADCLEYFLRLHHKGVNVALLPGTTAMSVPQYLQGLVGLYHDGQRPNSILLQRFTRWEQAEQSLGHQTGFRRIQDLLARGFSQEDCQRLIMAMTPPPTKSAVCLALPGAVKNAQYPRIQLSRAFVGSSARTDNAALLSQLYTAQTRATGELILPCEYHEWVCQRTNS